MDYRVKKKSGDYIRILEQTMSIKSSYNGYPILTLGICTDISHLKKANSRPDFKVYGPGSDKLDFPGTIQLHNSEHYSKLTKREKEILKLIAKGKCNKEIASRLFISEATAKTHRRNIKKKIGSQNHRRPNYSWHSCWSDLISLPFSINKNCQIKA